MNFAYDVQIFFSGIIVFFFFPIYIYFSFTVQSALMIRPICGLPNMLLLGLELVITSLALDMRREHDARAFVALDFLGCLNFQDGICPHESSSSMQHPRRPNLTTLLIPSRSMESPTPSSTRINITTVSSPNSTRAGLPPRPSPAKSRTLSMKNLLPQRSFKNKSVIPEGEKAVLITPGTPLSGEDKPSTSSKSFSLSKVFSSSKRTNSLPVTPVANSGAKLAAETLTSDQPAPVVTSLA